MKYVEDKNASAPYRAEYYSSLLSMLDKRRAECDLRRRGRIEQIKNDPETYRAELCKMLGWPLDSYDGGMPTAEQTPVFSDDTRTITKIQLTLPIGVKLYGILMTHTGEKKLPLVIAQHGGDSIPERLIGLFDGQTSNYNDMAERVFSRGVNVFLPGLLLWSERYYEPSNGEKPNNDIRRELDAKLKQVGSSITAVEIYGIRKAIDYLSTKPFVDTERIGMVGLSYGGFYTLFTAAVDTRIKAALASSQYNDRYEYSWSDWTWFSSAEKFLDNEVAALVCPRPLFLAVGDEDALFKVEGARRAFLDLKEAYPDSTVRFTVFHGAHEFVQDDEIVEKFIKEL